MEKFPSFRGSRDTRRHDGHDYDTITFADIAHLCSAPACAEKQDAPAFIASSYHGHLARSHYEQRRRGQFHALIADIDDGSPTLDDVDHAVVCIVGDHSRFIYSSSSASAEKMKWRVIVPIQPPTPGAAYAETQRAFFSAMADCGIRCDDALARAGQPVFLPNVPPTRRGDDGVPLFYHYRVHDSDFLTAVPEPIAHQAVTATKQMEEARRVAAEEARRKALERKRLREHANMLSPIEQFNTDHDLVSLLLEHGWMPRGPNRFASPYSQSKGASVYVYDQRAVSFTSSDAGQIGRVTANGWVTYDAWDVYVARVYGGHEAIALIEYREHSGYDQRVLHSILSTWGQK